MKRLNLYRNNNLYKLIFYILLACILMGTVIGLFALPRETDRFFTVDSGQTEEDTPAIEQFLYRGSCEWVKEDGTRETIRVPGKYRVETGHPFVVETVLPSDYKESHLIIRASQQDMKIYINGELRVDYDTKGTRPYGSQTTSRYVICETDSADAGAVVRIETVAHKSTYSGLINEIYACDKNDFWMGYLYRNGLAAIFNLAVLFVGLFALGITICLHIGVKQKMSLEYVGWCIVLAGLWLLGETKFRQILFPNVSVISDLCFYVIMLAPFPFLLYLDDVQNMRYHKWWRILMDLTIANVILSCALQIFNVADFLDLLPLSHVILVAMFVSVICSFIRDAQKKYISEYKDICIGFVIMMGAVMIEIIGVYTRTVLTGFLLALATMVFVGFALVKSINDIKKRGEKQHNERLEAEKKHTEEVTKQLIHTMFSTMESKNEYASGHSGRVADYASLIARRMGMSEKEIEDFRYAAFLHDIGWIGVPESVMNKPSELTPEEYDVIKAHTTTGADMIKTVDLISDAEKIARYHHERYDGGGYPSGLSGSEIPLEAGIVAVADAFDAMNSERAYRPPLSKDEIRKEVVDNRGTQFIPDVADAFLQLFDEGAFDKLDELREQVDEIYNPNGRIYFTPDEAGKVFSMVMDAVNSKNAEDEYDQLTGIFTRGRGERQIFEMMLKKPGTIIFVDMDNLKKINDLHGHSAGDKALKLVGEIISEIPGEHVACRMGGDEFLLYVNERNEDAIEKLVQNIIERFERRKSVDFLISEATLSVGIRVCDMNETYMEALSKADKALYFVKHRGKAGYHFYHREDTDLGESSDRINIEELNRMIRRSGKYSGAMELEYREFAKVYEYVSNLCNRYQLSCHLSLITLQIDNIGKDQPEKIERAMGCMEIAIRDNIRNVDVCSRYSAVQYLVILLEAGEKNIETINQRIFNRYYELCGNRNIGPAYQAIEYSVETGYVDHEK